MRQSISEETRENFCRVYLRTMDPQRAAEAAGRQDGYALLRDMGIARRLKKMREASAVTRADVIRRLCELAFGRTNDAVELALDGGRAADAGQMDLSAVAECKVTDKGVELKFIDRVRALEVLCGLLDDGDDRAERFFQALDAADRQRDHGDEASGVF